MRILLLCAATFPLGCVAPEPTPAGAAADYVALGAGARWTYEIFAGDRALVITMVAEGGDRRELDGRSTRYDFVYGTPEGMDHDVTKSIYAMAAAGPREFYFDGSIVRLFHDPPIPLLPERVVAGTTWAWTGTFEAGDFEGKARATLRIDGPECVTVPAGTFPAMRVHAVYEEARLEITRWYTRGVGLVRLDITAAGAVTASARLRAHSRSG